MSRRSNALRKPEIVEEAIDLDSLVGPHWRDLKWRLNNLYRIIDEHGKSVRFEMNEEQAEFIDNLHPRNLIVKARQMGFSTLVQILQADQGLFNANHNGVTIADSLPNSGKLFGKVEFALKMLAPEILEVFPIKARTARTGIEFEHGSSIYISTSSRGGTVQLLHVSEMGKIARKFPERSAEIITGAFESVPMDGCIIVESTTEGAAGDFYDLVMPALKRQQEGAPETAMDWRLHFFPWFRKKGYRLDPTHVTITDSDTAYFRKMEAEIGTVFDPAQRAWYVKKKETLGRLMKREYPSTIEEAFEQAVEGAVFGEEMSAIREQGRICVVPLDKEYPVNTFWDFGTGNRMPVWLHQRIGLQNRWVRYFVADGTGLGAMWRMLEDYRAPIGFAWGTHYLPHDADAEVLGESVTTKHRILLAAGMRSTSVVPRVAQKMDAIDLMRQKLPADNWFDRDGCVEGIKALDGYQFAWNEKMGVWSNEPLPNWASHGADAWMQYAQGYTPFSEAIDRSLRAFKNRKRRGI